MNQYVILLRGINVGGRNSLPMKQLVAILEGLGCQGVKTYIQSGNAVFQSKRSTSRLTTLLKEEIKRDSGFEPHVLVLETDELAAAIAANPFPEAEADPKGLHFGFLEAVPTDPDLAKLNALKSETERFRLIDRVFYLHAPDGVGRSKLAANSERLLGVAMTDRNWRTVSKIRDLVEDLG